MNEDGEETQLLANVIGNYAGSTPINFTKEDPVAFLKITADGPWTVTLVGMGEAVELPNVPGKHDGLGTQVVRFATDKATLVEFSCPGCDGNVVVFAWSADDRKLLVNEIGAYTGQVLVPGDNLFLQIKADARRGPAAWSVTVP